MSITIPGSEYTGPKSIAEEVSRREREAGWIEYQSYRPQLSEKEPTVAYRFRTSYEAEIDHVIKAILSLDKKLLTSIKI